MGAKAYLLISAGIFGLVSLGHLIRVINNWSFQIGDYAAPMGISWIAVLVAAAMCVWAISLASAEK